MNRSHPIARTTDPTTSHHAGAADGPYRSALRSRVLELHQAHPDGLTDDELVALLPNCHPGSVAKRRHDLTQLGRLEATSVRRPTRWGCAAVVWTLAPPAPVWRAMEGRYLLCGCEVPALTPDRMCRVCQQPILSALLGAPA